MAYSQERRAAVLVKMLPPSSMTIAALSRQEGISEKTLYKWRREARAQGRLAPDAGEAPAGWTSRDKFAAVVETAALNVAETAAYCRERGLYPEQIAAWRAACEGANDRAQAVATAPAHRARGEAKRLRALERELARKEKALAEAAALLTLRKKAAAIWGEEDA
jgi:transposase-like protein